jgi:membrane protein
LEWQGLGRDMVRIAQVKRVLSSAAAGWWADRALSMGASIAFYTLFALAPMLLTAVAVAGLVFGREAAQGALVSELGGLVGTTGAEAVEVMLANAWATGAGILATIIGTGTFLVLMTGAFVELQDSLNLIWKAKPPENWGVALIRTRLVSFAFVLGIGFLLLVSLVVDAVLAILGTYLGNALPGWPTLLLVFNSVLALGSSILLFTTIFKILPNAFVAWHDAWIGGIMTGLMFTLGKFLIGFYIGQSGVASTYGAAASVVTILLWIYYSSQIVLFGAEITKAYAKTRAEAETSPDVV